jgi:hypothetical protein
MGLLIFGVKLGLRVVGLHRTTRQRPSEVNGQ